MKTILALLLGAFVVSSAAETKETTQASDADAQMTEAQTQEEAKKQKALQAVVEGIYTAYPDSKDSKSFFSYRMSQEVATYEAKYGPVIDNPTALRVMADTIAAEMRKAGHKVEQADAQAAAPDKPAATPQQAQEDPLVVMIKWINEKFPDSKDPQSYFSKRLAEKVMTYENLNGPIRKKPIRLMDLANQVDSEISRAKTSQQLLQQRAPSYTRPAPAPPPEDVAALEIQRKQAEIQEIQRRQKAELQGLRSKMDNLEWERMQQEQQLRLNR